MIGFSIFTRMKSPDLLTCKNPPDEVLFSEGFSGSSQWFVAIGVISMLYIFAILAVYLLLWPHYENDARFANAVSYVFIILKCIFISVYFIVFSQCLK